MNKKFLKIIDFFYKKYGHLKPFLYFTNTYELFVASLLSPQMRDDRLNPILKSFFKKYKSFYDLANADLLDIQKELKQVNFYKTKSLNLYQNAKIIVKKYKGKVPCDMSLLLQFKGVGEKVANVFLTEGCNKYEGIVVDTHVRRVVSRIFFGSKKTVSKIKDFLEKNIDKKYFRDISLWFIKFGRQVCTARRPKCDVCPFYDICEFKNFKK